MTAVSTTTAYRQRLIKLIHVARRELGYDDPTYRAVLQAAGNADSTSKMPVSALMAVLERLKASGFKVRPKGIGRSQTSSPDTRKVRALWLFLHALGAVRDPSESALAAYVKRVAKVDDLRWARGEAVTVLIETLKKWAMRFLPAAVAALQREVIQLQAADGLDQEQLDQVRRSSSVLTSGQGFDAHWWAWEALMGVLSRPVRGEMRVLESAS